MGFLRKYKAINCSLDICTIFAMSLRVPAWIKIGMLNNKFWEMWLVSSSCKEHHYSFLQPLSKVVIPLRCLIEWILNWILSNFSKSFFTFRINRIANFQIESNEFRTNPFSDNLTPTCSWNWIKRIEFKSIFIEVFEYFLQFWINQIVIFQIELNKF